MEAFRPRKSPLSERFLGSFSKTPGTVTQTPTATASNGGGGEFDEGEVFWIGTDFSSASSMPAHTGTTASHSISTSGSFRRVAPEKNFGILAALQEDEKKRATIRNPSFLQRKPSISSAAASPLSSPSSSKSSTTSARMMMIPVVPKPKQEHAYSLPAGRGHQQSAPVNVPVAARRRAAWVEEVEGVDEGNDDDEEMLPPHEMVARASAKESPLMTFSVLEGVGRTLKGRDLRRVRNAVWRQTGFLD